MAQRSLSSSIFGGIGVCNFSDKNFQRVGVLWVHYWFMYCSNVRSITSLFLLILSSIETLLA